MECLNASVQDALGACYPFPILACSLYIIYANINSKVLKIFLPAEL